MSALVEMALQKALAFNPAVTIHELRMRMRGFRPFGALLATTILASAAVLITYYWYDAFDYYGDLTNVGRYCFYALSYTLLLVITIGMPVYAAGALTMETEKGTVDMLRATLLTPADVVTGKLLVVLAFGLMLLASTAPIAAWCVLLGGLEPMAIVRVYVFLAAVSAAGVALGGFVSAWQKRTVVAMAITFGLIVLWNVIPPVIGAVLEGLKYSLDNFDEDVFSTLIGIGILAVWSFMGAWMLYVALAWGLSRIHAKFRKTALGTGIASGGCILVLVLFLTRFSAALSNLVGQAEMSVLFLMTPFVQLILVIEESFAEEMIGSVTSSGGTPAVTAGEMQLLVWLLTTGGAIFLSVFLWSLAVRKFGAKW